MDNLLRVENLCVSINTASGTLFVLNDLTYRIPRGKTVGLVGESGCGKSISALAILGLLPKQASLNSGNIIFDGEVISNYDDETYRKKIRGKKISIIFQDAMAALNPVFTVGNQIEEALKIRYPKWSKKELRQQAIEVLVRVRIPHPAQQIKSYPHQLSGGMRQRVMIAMALAAEPELLIADEPTTALDVTIQAQVLDLMMELQELSNTSILLITHDMAVVAEMCDEINVMYGGQVIEWGNSGIFFEKYSHPYTEGLLNSLPQGKTKKEILANIPGNVKPYRRFPRNCVFVERCHLANEKCQSQRPALEAHSQSLMATACFEADQVARNTHQEGLTKK